MLGEGNLNNIARDENGISGIVDWLLQYAFDERASDIHIESKHGTGVIRFRIDGTLRTVYKFEPIILLSILSRLKIMSGMKVDEKRRPQDGRIKRQISEDKTIEIRSSTIPTHYGEKLVMRIFDPQMADKNIKEIGFSQIDETNWKQIISHNHGLVLVTGPTGSGKSTTLHASLKEVNRPEINICTAEDPIEIVNEDFNQMQIYKEVDITFGSAIRHFLRQDPDIIMVGEIRDSDTAEMAVQASLTGHMVFSTLHTNDALASITRLIDLGVPPHLLNAVLKGVLAQRLVRVLCKHCKKLTPTDLTLWKSLIEPYGMPAPENVYKAVGCPECKNSGYMGRECIYEMVTFDEDLKKAIHKDVELSELKKVAYAKFLPLRLNGAEKVKMGITSIDEILRVVV